MSHRLFNRTKKMSAALMLFAVTLFFVAPKTHAQAANQPQLAVTWQASQSYVPSDYSDKALPNQISKITASLALVDGNIEKTQHEFEF